MTIASSSPPMHGLGGDASVTGLDQTNDQINLIHSQ